MKLIFRIVIAVIFILSGFVKAVDVRGFSFKLEEYFSPTVFNIPFLENWALPLAIFVVALELLLGLMLLFKIQLKKTLIALIALCVFFAFLTFYSAYFNKVTDCGCFGDAIKFTPWQSFYKDLVLLIGLVILWLLYRKEPQKSASKFSKSLLVISCIVFGAVMIYGVKYEPIIDFRDYKIGTDLVAERQKIDENPSEYKTIYALKNTKTQEVKKVDSDTYVEQKEYWEEGTPWQILEGQDETVLVKEGYASEIAKFKLEDEIGADLTSEILAIPKVILIFSYHPDKVLERKDLNDLKTAVKAKLGNASVYEVNSVNEPIFSFPKLFMDATAIKTIARSNPSVLVLEKGKIVKKESLDEFLSE